MNIFKKLEELNLPLGEYVVIGGGILAALNLRETNDLDLAISEKLQVELIKSGKFTQEIRYNKLFLIAEDVEIATQLNWGDYKTTAEMAIKNSINIKNFPFLNIEETIKFKQALGREKDIRDIELLKKYLANLK